MGIKDYLKEEKVRTDKVLASFLLEREDEAKRVDKDYWKMVGLMRSQLLRGGKRLRPALLRLAYRLAGGKESKEIVKASLFVELVHANLLVHDDIADKDLKRYGGPTLEVEFGEWFKRVYGKSNDHFGMTYAMIAGDYLRNLANRALHESNFDPNVKSRCQLIMSETLDNTMAGWQIHFWQNFQKIDQAEETKFLQGMELVSARYTFVAPLMVGLTLAGGEKGFGKMMQEYAYNAGMAFQIQDDILGVFGETEKTGKPVGNDIREGKKTLLVLRAYRKSGLSEKRVLEKAVGNEHLDGEINRVRQIIVDSGSLEYSVKKAKAHVAKAQEALVAIRKKAVDKEAVDRLGEIAEFVVARSY